MHSKHVWRRGLNYSHYITLFSSKIDETDRALRKGTRSLFQGSVSWGRLSNLPKGPSRTLDIDCRKTKSLRTSYFSFSYWLVNCQSCNIGRPCQCYNFGSWQVSNWRKIEDERSPPVREFGFQNPGIFSLWNPGSWALESGIPLRIGIRKPGSINKQPGIRNPPREIQNPRVLSFGMIWIRICDPRSLG